MKNLYGKTVLVGVAVLVFSTMGFSQISLYPATVGIFDAVFGQGFMANVFQAADTNTSSKEISTNDDAVLATETWDGNGTNNSWTTNDNWAGIGGAGPGDALIFPQTAARKSNDNDFPVNTSFSDVTFTGTNYVITGNQIFLTGGVNCEFTDTVGNSPIFHPNIILGGDQLWSSGSVGFRPCILSGVVNLNGHTLTLNGFGNHRLDGLINGTGTLVKFGAGTAVLGGNSPSFGTTIINLGGVQVDGTLGNVQLSSGRLSGAGTVGAIDALLPTAPNDGVVSPGVGSGAGLLTASGSTQFAATSTFAVDLNGPTFPGQYDRLNVTGGSSIQLNGANLDVSLGFTPTPGQQFTIMQIVGAGGITGQFAQGTSITVGGRLFAITYNSQNVVLTAIGTSLTWDGGGATNDWSEAANWNPNFAPADGLDLVFPDTAPADSRNMIPNINGLSVGTMTFTGGDYIVGFNNVSAVTNGITCNITSGTNGTVFNNNIFLGQTAPLTNNGTRSCTFAGALHFQVAASVLTVNGTGDFNLNGLVTGTSGIVKNGTGKLVLGSSNDYLGVTTVNDGFLRVNNNNALGATGSGNNTVVANGGTLQLINNVINVPEAISLSGTGFGGVGALITADGICNPGCSISGAVTLASNSTVAIGNATDKLTLNGVVQGTAGLTKIGPGTLILGATNTYNGPTTVNAGTLLANGNNSNSPVNLTGGTLGGIGIVKGINATGGTVAPGNNGPGTLTVLGNINLLFNVAATFNVEIGGINTSEYDRLIVASQQGIIVGMGGANLAGSLTGGFNPTPGTQFKIVSTEGTANQISGQFAQGSSVVIGGRRFNITYNLQSVVLTATANKAPADFDGDGKTDISIFRPAPGEWWYQKSSNNQVTAAQFGQTTDKITPGDFTGDGKTDIALWRPSDGFWYVLRSEDFSFFAFPFGNNGDVPAPADYDGDGKSDAAVFRPSAATWFISRSADGGTTIAQFGAAGDAPAVADYDGDGKADIAIWRPSVGEWWIQKSSNNTVFATQFGASTDKAVQGDYTGDGKADIAFWRPSTGSWFILRSEDFSFFSFPFGTTGDVVAPGDYDGDGKFDAAVFRPSNVTWFVQRTTTGTLIQQFGAAGDIPVPAAFVP